MAINPNELYRTLSGNSSGPAVLGEVVQTKTFQAGGVTLGLLQPLTFDTATESFKPWSIEVTEAQWTIDMTLTALQANNGGVFEIEIIRPGFPTVTIGSRDVTINFTAQDMIDDWILPGNPLEGKIAGTGSWNATTRVSSIKLTLLGEAGSGASMNKSYQDCEGTVTVTNNIPYAQTATPVHGFVWPNPVVLNPSQEVQGTVLLGGEFSVHDVPVPVSGDFRNTLLTVLQSAARNKWTITGLARSR